MCPGVVFSPLSTSSRAARKNQSLDLFSGHLLRCYPARPGLGHSLTHFNIPLVSLPMTRDGRRSPRAPLREGAGAAKWRRGGAMMAARRQVAMGQRAGPRQEPRGAGRLRAALCSHPGAALLGALPSSVGSLPASGHRERLGTLS